VSNALTCKKFIKQQGLVLRLQLGSKEGATSKGFKYFNGSIKNEFQRRFQGERAH
jgi:hypothetical protein